MTSLTDAAPRLLSLIHLLKDCSGLDLTAQIYHGDAGEGGGRPELAVELGGPDSYLLLEREAELLLAIEHIAAKVLRLERAEYHRLSVDAHDFKASHDRDLRRLANEAVIEVSLTLVPYTFPPMLSRDRRTLHLALASSGLRSVSVGDRPHRSVVLCPEGVLTPIKVADTRSVHSSRPANRPRSS